MTSLYEDKHVYLYKYIKKPRGLPGAARGGRKPKGYMMIRIYFFLLIQPLEGSWGDPRGAMLPGKIMFLGTTVTGSLTRLLMGLPSRDE